MAETRLTRPRAEDLRPRLRNKRPGHSVGKAQTGIDEDLKLEDQGKQERNTLLQNLTELMIVQELGDHWNRYAQEPQDGPSTVNGLMTPPNPNRT